MLILYLKPHDSPWSI